MNVFINREKMWFGTADYMQWIDTPETGADVSSQGFSVDNVLLNGGGYARNSWDSHKTYQFSWGQSASLALSHAINAYRNGSWGRGLIYFHDPMTYGTNILPKRWADPSMAANYEAEPIIPDVYPTTTPAAPGSALLPVTTATFALPTGYSSQTNNSELFIPIPPGMTLILGAVYSGNGKLYVRVDGNPPQDISPLDSGTLSVGSVINTKVTGSKAYLGVRNTTGAASSISIQGIVARLADAGSIPDYMGVPVVNRVVNPSFENAAGTVDVITNVATDPSFEGAGPATVVRTNLNPNPRMYPTAIRWNTTSPTNTLTSTATGAQIDVVTGPATVPMIFNAADIAQTSGDRFTASIEASVPAGYPAAPLRLDVYAYGTNAVIGTSGNVIVQPGQTITLSAPSTSATSATTTGVRMIVYGGTGGVPTGGRIVFRNALLEKALTPGPYFDGTGGPVLRTNRMIFAASPSSWSGPVGTVITPTTDSRFGSVASVAYTTNGYVTFAQALNAYIGETHTLSIRHGAPSGTMPTIGLALFGGGSPPTGTTTRGYIDNGDGTFTSWITTTFNASGNYTPLLNLNGFAASTMLVGDPMLEFSAGVTPFFSGASTKLGYSYAFAGAVNSSASTEADADFSVRWQGTVNDSPSEVTGIGSTGVASGAGVAAIRSLRNATMGTYSLRLVPTSWSDNVSYVSVARAPMTGAYTAMVTLIQEGSITGSTWASRGRPYLTPPQTSAPNTAPNAAGTTQFNFTGTVTSGGSVILPHGGLVGSGDVWYDALTIVAGTYTGPAFSGSSVSTDPDMTYAWTGAVNASTSVLRGTGIASWASTASFAIQSGLWSADGVKSARIISAGTSVGSYIAQTMPGLTVGATYTVLGTIRVVTPITASDPAALGFRIANGPSQPVLTYSKTAMNTPGTYEVRATFVATGTSHTFLAYNGSVVAGEYVQWDKMGLFAGDYTGPWGAGTFTSAITTEIAMGPWMTGEGHSGARFVGTPTTVNYNGVDGGQMGVSCTLKEVGAWA